MTEPVTGHEVDNADDDVIMVIAMISEVISLLVSFIQFRRQEVWAGKNETQLN